MIYRDKKSIEKGFLDIQYAFLMVKAVRSFHCCLQPGLSIIVHHRTFLLYGTPEHDVHVWRKIVNIISSWHSFMSTPAQNLTPSPCMASGSMIRDYLYVIILNACISSCD